MNDSDAQIGLASGFNFWLLEWKYSPLSTSAYNLTLPTLLAVTAWRIDDVGRLAWIGISPVIALEAINFIGYADFLNVEEVSQITPNSKIAALSAFLFIVIVLGFTHFF